jgi:hypothetical protein
MKANPDIHRRLVAKVERAEKHILDLELALKVFHFSAPL